MSDGTDTLSEREEIEMLLPWFVTGRLDRADAARVELYLASHPEMRRQLDLIREERIETTRANEAIRAPATLTIERVLAAQAAGARPRVLGIAAGLWQAIRSFFEAPTGGAVRLAAAAVAAVMLVQALAIGSLLTGSREPGYQTASGGAATQADGTFAIVKFTDAAGAKAVADLLFGLGMTIADGPKPGGTFVVRIGPKGLAEAEQRRRIEVLQARTDLVALVMASR